MKELTGNVVRSGDGCILLGEYSVYEENLKLEQINPAMRDGTADRLPHFFCDLLVVTSGASISLLLITALHVCIFAFDVKCGLRQPHCSVQVTPAWAPTIQRTQLKLKRECESKYCKIVTQL
jgi:hypothetical protein